MLLLLPVLGSAVVRASTSSESVTLVIVKETVPFDPVGMGVNPLSVIVLLSLDSAYVPVNVYDMPLASIVVQVTAGGLDKLSTNFE